MLPVRRWEAVVVLGFDQSQRVQAAGLDLGGGRLTQTAAPARSVGHAVQRHGIAHEDAFHEDTWIGVGIAGIEAQLYFFALEACPDLYKAAIPAHGPILTNGAFLAMEKDVGQVFVVRDGAQAGQFLEPVFAWHAACRSMAT